MHRQSSHIPDATLLLLIKLYSWSPLLSPFRKENIYLYEPRKKKKQSTLVQSPLVVLSCCFPKYIQGVLYFKHKVKGAIFSIIREHFLCQ